TIERSRRGTCQARASNWRSASLARPSWAGAVTDAFSTRRPSAEMAIPIRRSALACGDRRTVTRTPSPATINGPSDKVFEHQVARKPQDQDQDHWRDVDSTEIREN